MYQVISKPRIISRMIWNAEKTLYLSLKLIRYDKIKEVEVFFIKLTKMNFYIDLNIYILS